MNYLLRPLAAILILTFHSIAFCQTSATLEEFHQRDGLPNFFKKVKSGQETRIAYVGGSITEAENGWRSLTYQWITDSYPATKFQEINATIGGTGSNLGVFRMDRDVLPYKPDLVFVEFAVNDGSGAADAIQRSMEGIVRKIWKQNRQTDICFVYTVAENVIKNLQEGRYQSSAEAMEKVAEHYGVPSIHMGVEVARLLDAGKLIFTGKPAEHPDKIVFSTDGVHPLTASGHPVYAETVKRNFQKMAGAVAVMNHDLKAPLIADNWENAQMISLDKLNKDHWTKLPANDPVLAKVSKFMPELFKATPPEATLTVRFKGKVFGLYDVIGPGSGIVDMVVDGQTPVEMVRFDAWGNYYRKNAFFIKDLNDGEHEVTFKVTGRPFDKAAILQKRNITIENPADYQENTWLLNSILLIGELREVSRKQSAQIEEAMQPFWKGDLMRNESVMMISKDGGTPEARLLFKPKKIISVTDAAQQTSYVKGVDWDYQDGKLVLLPGSKAISMKYTELYPDSAEKSFPKRGGGKVLFAEGAFFHNKQLAVTYTHGKNEWEGLKPVFQKDNLTVSLDLLKNKKPVRILLFGDSISAGANASGKSNAAPNLPTFGTLIVEKLKSYYQTDITFTNTAVGGKNSDWGLQTIQENVNAYSPDLVIIAFGMNDGTGKIPAAKFKENILGMISAIKAKKPDTEFILVSTMLPNPESLFLGTQPDYTQVLQELTTKGTVLVDMTAVHRELLKHKSYEDLTGNHINHPNDFLIRWYAQEIAGVLMP